MAEAGDAVDARVLLRDAAKHDQDASAVELLAAETYSQLADSLPADVALWQQLLDKMETLERDLQSVKEELHSVKEDLRASNLQSLLREQWTQARSVNHRRHLVVHGKFEPLRTLPDVPQLEPGQRAVPPELGPAPRDFPKDTPAVYNMSLAACKRLLMAYNQPSPPEDEDSAHVAVLAFIGCTQEP